MRKITYNLLGGGKKEYEYDENAPCVSCGEPVLSASMGGTSLCPSCDLGKCRYCKISLPYPKEGILEHMVWHRTETPDVVKEFTIAMRRANDFFDARKEAVK